MANRVLIAGQSSPLLYQLSREAHNAGHQVVVTREPDEQLPPQTDVQHVVWNRRSPLGPRTVLLETRKRIGNPDWIVICHADPGQHPEFHLSPPSRIEHQTDNTIKAYLFMAREAIGQFLTSGGGSLTVVEMHPGAQAQAPIAGLVSGAMEAFTDALGRAYESRGIHIQGFGGDDTDPEGFAAFVMEADTGRTARWQQFSGRLRRSRPPR